MVRKQNLETEDQNLSGCSATYELGTLQKLTWFKPRFLICIMGTTTPQRLVVTKRRKCSDFLKNFVIRGIFSLGLLRGPICKTNHSGLTPEEKWGPIGAPLPALTSSPPQVPRGVQEAPAEFLVKYLR